MQASSRNMDRLRLETLPFQQRSGNQFEVVTLKIVILLKGLIFYHLHARNNIIIKLFGLEYVQYRSII